MIALRKRLPSLHESLALYATIVFLIYGWAVVMFLWKVPSWLYFLSVGEIIAIFSYTLASCLLESTTILFILLLMGFILPARWLSDKFIVRGSITVYILTFWVALFNLDSLIQLPTSSDIVSFGVGFLLTIGLAIIAAERSSVIQKKLSALGDRLTVFLYLWLPLGVLGILIVLLRVF